MGVDGDELMEKLMDHAIYPSSTNGASHSHHHQAIALDTSSSVSPVHTPTSPPSASPSLSLTPLSVASPRGSVLPLTSVPARHRAFLYLLCVCALFMTFRPSEPYLTQYLMEDKGLGPAVVNEKVYPVWTYSFFAFLVPTGMAGEWFGYRAIIGLEFAALLVTYAILVWGEGVAWMQAMQVTYGFSSAAQSCVFFTYVYRCCPPELYHTATGYQRAAFLMGHVLGALVGQVLVSTGHPRWQLLLPTLTAVSVAAVAFYFLPTPQQQHDASPAAQIAEEREKLHGSTPHSLSSPRSPSLVPFSSASSSSSSTSFSPSSSSFSAAPPPSFTFGRLLSLGALRFTRELLGHLAAQYRHRHVALFSVYVVLGNSVLELLLNYDLSLWYALDPTFQYNGAVLAVGWLLSAAAAFLTSVAVVVAAVSMRPCAVLSVLSASAALLVLSSTWTDSVYVACALFVAFYALMSFLMVVSSALIASSMSFTAFALLFSINTFMSLAVQSLVQLCIGEYGWSLTIQDKYRVFGAQLLGLSALYAAIGLQQSMAQRMASAGREA